MVMGRYAMGRGIIMDRVSKYKGWRFKAPWVGGRYTMGKGCKNTMGRGVKIPITMDMGSIYHG
jgi:hypothetical protein